MKDIFKAIFIEILIIVFSFILIIIGVLYSDDSGFDSREWMSSGGDDFDLFIGLTHLNIYGIIFGFINVVINIILLNKYKKVIYISFIIYKTIFFIQLIVLFLIHLDTDLIYEYFKFDLYSLWFSIYIFGILVITLSKYFIENFSINIKFIKIGIYFKILIIILFICIIIFTWRYLKYLLFI